MTRSWMFALLTVCLGIPAIANALSEKDSPRGELLYTTHCIACHNDKIHWRDNKVARNWSSLKAQVQRWQAVEGLKWSTSDIGEVARYLNSRYYHYPEQVQ
jgi:mono/diheme cytochrome c family protein